MTERAVTIAALDAERIRIEARLTRGERLIDEAQAEGKEVTAWEDHWISLLKDYESLCDQLLKAA